VRQVPPKRPMRHACSKLNRVQLMRRDQDRAYLEALARILDGHDAAAGRLRDEIEQILAEEPCSGEITLLSGASARR
jgi:hypothetical protein